MSCATAAGRAARHRPGPVRRAADRHHAGGGVGPRRRRPGPLWRAGAPRSARPTRRCSSRWATSAGGLVVAEPGQVPRALGSVDVVLPLLHGPFGEDGTLQGLLEMAGVRYVGSGVLASAAGMDKHYMKVILAGHGLPVGPYTVITPADLAHRQGPGARRRRLPRLPGVRQARPGRLLAGHQQGRAGARTSRPPSPRPSATTPRSSSRPASTAARSSAPCSRGTATTPRAPRVPGEIVLDAAGVGLLRLRDEVPRHRAADHGGAGRPARRRSPRRCAALAADAFDALGCEGLARVDFFYDGRRVIINEVNTMPGLHAVLDVPAAVGEDRA